MNPRRGKIPLTRPYFDSEEMQEVLQVLDSGWVSEGPKVREFEKDLERYLGVKHVIATSNCTCALHMSLLALGIHEGDEVIVPDYTFPATAHAVLYCRAKPVFTDVDLRTYNVDPESIKAKITDRTKAIVPVHTFGQPAIMDEIMEIANDHALKIVEDAACALGAKFGTSHAGTMGDAGCFSLHGRKGITTGEGGIIAVKDDALAENMRKLRAFGMTSSAWEREEGGKFTIPEFKTVGYNYKMSDVTAALGVAQLRKLDEIVQKRRDLAHYWNDKIEEIPLLTSPHVAKKAYHTYQSYVATVDKRVSRNRLIDLLNASGVQSTIGTYACHLQAVYCSNDRCPNSAELYNTSIALPLYYSLREIEIDHAVEALSQAVDTLS